MAPRKKSVAPSTKLEVAAHWLDEAAVALATVDKHMSMQCSRAAKECRST